MPKNDDTNASASTGAEPTIKDVIALFSTIPNKDDFEDMKIHLATTYEENRQKIEIVEQNLSEVRSTSASNANKIAELEDTIHILHQDKLRNNVCISGVSNGGNIGVEQTVIAIAKALQVNITDREFTAHTTANANFIIVEFSMFSIKHSLLNKIRAKRSLMLEEVFATVRSNSQIYINDHLTKHFSELFKIARQAKRDGKLASVSALGGRIKVRKHFDDIPTIITNVQQLNILVEMEADESQETIQNPDRSVGDRATTQHCDKPRRTGVCDKADKQVKGGKSKRPRNRSQPNEEETSAKVKKTKKTT